MKIEINIDDQLIERTKKTFSRRNVLIGLTTVCVLASAIAIAAPGDPVPNSFTAGDVISAAEVNDNFTEVTTQIGSVQRNVMLEANGESLPSVGLFCGASETSSTGNFSSFLGATRYAAGRDYCQAASSCGSSPTAHMCTSHEIALSLQLGIDVTQGWISTFSTSNTGGVQTRDCEGWSSADASQQGTGVVSGMPVQIACDSPQLILCCDTPTP